ncbi:MAG: porin [Sulfuricaulis sp.]
MKMKLLFVAVGAALSAAPMVVVHADTTLYGHLHEAFENVDNGTSKFGAVESNSSRFGIKGNEDLGDGLKAIYQMESGIFNVNDGTGGLGGTLRNTYMGFAGSWGAVKVGRYDSPFKELGRTLDNFNEEVGDMRNILSGSSSGASIYDSRFSNMIRYESPTMAGFNVNFAHSSKNGPENVPDPTHANGKSANSLGANWSGMGFFAGVAYQKDGFNQGGLVTKDHDNAWRLAGSYSFMEDATVGLIYQDLKDMFGEDLEQKAKGLTASYRLANNLIKFHYITADDESGTACGTKCSSTGGKLWALGVDHSFSKSTLVYVNYAEAKNDSNQSGLSVVSGNGGNGLNDLPTKTGQTVKGITTGMILNF